MNSRDAQNPKALEQATPSCASSSWLAEKILDPVKAKHHPCYPSPAKIPFLFSLLTLQEAAAWWRLTPRDLSGKTKGRRPIIHAIRINQRVIRFCPLLMLAQAAGRSGIPMKEFIAAVVSQIPPQFDWNQLVAELETIDKNIDEDREW